jgi:hypothetical protein
MHRAAVGALFFSLAASGWAQQPAAPAAAPQFERNPEVIKARTALSRAADANLRDAAAQRAYAEFLDRYHDPDRRAAYDRLLTALPETSPERATVARRLVVLDLIAGEREAAQRHLQTLQAAGGQVTAEVRNALQQTSAAADVPEAGFVEIPGTLPGFQRMTAVSRDIDLADLLPALARNIVTNGYQASHSTDSLEQTEYLKLVTRYLSLARELSQLAGSKQRIEVTACESQEAGQLLRILGYRLRSGCGEDGVLETVNASRAFLTIDSGFPVADLEDALRRNQPFRYEYQPIKVPVMFGAAYWLGEKAKPGTEFIDAFIADPALARLYLAFSKLDPLTVAELRKAHPMERWKAYSHVLDFFGAGFELHEGRITVPGGERSVRMWTELAGAPPEKGAEFIEKLASRDDGWLASYYDALSRTRGPLRDYFTEPERMKRFYQAVRGKVTSPGPARPVFRSNADMLLLTSRLQIRPDGTPEIPGGLEPWKQLFVNHPHGKYDGKLTRAATTWKTSDDLVEALFALCRKTVENEPLKMFMAISDLERRRRTPLAAATVTRLTTDYRRLSAQYALFSEAPGLSEETILAQLDTMAALSKVRDPGERADTVGTYQALISLWQILARQGQIPPARTDETLKSLSKAFASIKNTSDLFDAGRNGVRVLLAATGSREDASPQDRMIELLAGQPGPADHDAHAQMVADLNSLFEAQRLISLRTLFDLSDHLEGVARGEKLNVAMVNRLAARIAEIRLPRTTLTTVEKNAFSFGYWTEKHIEDQRNLNLRQLVDRAQGQAERLKDLRGRLAPILRDTLAGFSYIYYSPPGAQIIRTNPLFVRSHDFLGVQATTHTWRASEMFGTGWPSNGGGRLLGSLSGLAYALAEAEQNFLIPTNVQALIWGDLVPQMMLSAKIPRWWQVSPVEQHWLALHLRLGEELIGWAAIDPAQRATLLERLATQVNPVRRYRLNRFLERGQVPEAIEQVTPSELYLLARRHLEESGSASAGPLERELRRLATAEPALANPERISATFGSPHPTLANSYRPELLNLPTLPTLMGYSSRIMAESWESNNLYWAALADELYLPPSQLNFLVPELTKQVVERIFATHLEDWPAILRSLRSIGDDYRSKARPRLINELKASLN